MKTWQNAIRHNLSLGQKKYFTKVERDGQGCLWLLKPEVDLNSTKKNAGKAKKPNDKKPNNLPGVPQHNLPGIIFIHYCFSVKKQVKYFLYT